jgi:hypothetical protein
MFILNRASIAGARKENCLALQRISESAFELKGEARWVSDKETSYSERSALLTKIFVSVSKRVRFRSAPCVNLQTQTA